jgi:hypothetical protein
LRWARDRPPRAPSRRPGREHRGGHRRRPRGLTNRQIAQRLHITTKTVEMHLTRTDGKLGIARRSALARLLTGTQPRP